jgi:hypothetical protein
VVSTAALGTKAILALVQQRRSCYTLLLLLLLKGR